MQQWRPSRPTWSGEGTALLCFGLLAHHLLLRLPLLQRHQSPTPWCHSHSKRSPLLPTPLSRHGALLSHYSAAAADAKDGEEAAELEAAVHKAQVGAAVGRWVSGRVDGWLPVVVPARRHACMPAWPARPWLHADSQSAYLFSCLPACLCLPAAVGKAHQPAPHQLTANLPALLPMCLPVCPPACSWRQTASACASSRSCSAPTSRRGRWRRPPPCTTCLLWRGRSSWQTTTGGPALLAGPLGGWVAGCCVRAVGWEPGR